MSTKLPFKCIEMVHDVYRGKDCMKKFGEFLWEHAMKIFNFKKEKMKLLTNGKQKSCKVKKNLKINKLKIKNI